MADIYTDSQDEDWIIAAQRHGFGSSKTPKWTLLRIALAKSLRMPTAPDDSLDRLESRGSEYHLEQVTGLGQKEDELGPRDFNDALCAVLSIYHQENLFKDDKHFRQLLQRHIRRGLREMRLSWRPGHDFYDYLYHELFTEAQALQTADPTFAQRLLKALNDIGVQAEIREEKQGPRLSRFFLYLAQVQDYDKLQKGLEKLSFLLGGEQGLFLRANHQPQIVGLDVPRPQHTWATISGLRDWLKNAGPSEEILPVWPGVDVLGQPYHFDLATAPHLFVGGTTGSGKSVCLHALLLSLLWQLNPQQLQVCLIDPKRIEFSPYASLPHLYQHQVVTTAEATVHILNQLVKEMEQRIAQLEKLGVNTLQAALDSGRVSLPYIVVFIEELSDLFLQAGDEVEAPLIRLAQMARATGIHLILATQRPDAITFKGLLRSNIPARIALTVQRSSESKIILDQTGAEKLLKYGDMLIKLTPGEAPVRIHGVWITRDDIAACIREAL